MDDINKKLEELPENERKIALEILKEYSEKLKRELAISSKKNSELMQNYDEIETKIDEVKVKNQE